MLCAQLVSRLPLSSPLTRPFDRSAPWFIAVGCAAAAVHWVVVVLLVERAAWQPLVANVAGWAVAFLVSFAGHHRLSFRGHGVPARLAACRFLAISGTGFALNEVSYAVLLRTTSHGYEWLLAAVLVGVAAFTYWASRHWAFLRKPTRP